MLCRSAIDVDRKCSELRNRAPDDRIYVLRCHGKSMEHPHAPGPTKVEVLETYRDGSWKSVKVTQVLIELPYDYFDGWRKWYRRNKPWPELPGKNNTVMEYKDMNDVPPKCLICGCLLEENKKVGQLVAEGETWRCPEGSRRPGGGHESITYIIVKVKIRADGKDKAKEPVPVDWDLLHDFRKWISESEAFDPEKYVQTISYAEHLKNTKRRAPASASS